MGSVARAPRESVMAVDSDVDISVLIDGPTPGWIPIDELHRGVAIEAGLRSIEEYRGAEAVLANPDIADHLAIDSILDDPTGLLREIQPAVARDFALQPWVAARCVDEKRRVAMHYEAARAGESTIDVATGVIQAVLNLSGLIAVALLRTPTHRKSLVNLRSQLTELGRAELAEEALAVCGLADLTPARTTFFLDASARAFDRAIQVKRRPSLLDFKLKPHLRPYVVDGPREMIETGHHREAAMWIGFTLIIACMALQNDAPEEERGAYAELLDSFFDECGYGEPSAWPQHFRSFEALRDSVYALADDIVAGR